MTVEHRTFKRAPSDRAWTDSTVPSSSMLAVNIQVPFHCKLVRRHRVNRNPVYANGIRPPRPPDSAGQRQRFESAQDLRPVVEEDAVHRIAFERRPIQLAACLD